MLHLGGLYLGGYPRDILYSGIIQPGRVSLARPHSGGLQLGSLDQHADDKWEGFTQVDSTWVGFTCVSSNQAGSTWVSPLPQVSILHSGGLYLGGYPRDILYSGIIQSGRVSLARPHIGRLQLGSLEQHADDKWEGFT